ncbi:TPA: hypothetical protein NKA91_003726 [Vibrio parahaemolyticus]|nr:hypothetical protein [Vibrio parahaemolyticus]
MKSPESNDLDLKAHRCPNAMTMARMGLSRAIKEGVNEYNIYSIEPLLGKHISAYLNDVQCKFEIHVESVRISDEHKKLWCNESTIFDEDDFEFAEHYCRYRIAFFNKSNYGES